MTEQQKNEALVNLSMLNADLYGQISELRKQLEQQKGEVEKITKWWYDERKRADKLQEELDTLHSQLIAEPDFTTQEAN